MRILGLLVVLCFAYVSDAFAACAPTRMLRIVTTVDAFGLPADHFVTQPKTLYRYGSMFGRVEEVFNKQTGLHLLVVVSEPDVWVVNRVNNSGQHMTDRGTNIDFHAPIITATKSEHWRKLEFGCEEDFMKSVNAKTEPADGGMTRYSHEAEGIKASLVVNPKQRPERLEIESAEARFIVKYTSYEDSDPHGRSASKSAAALLRMSAAASTAVWALAIGNCTPWLAPSGLPKSTRWLEYATARSTNQRPSPIDSDATRMRSTFMPSRM